MSKKKITKSGRAISRAKADSFKDSICPECGEVLEKSYIYHYEGFIISKKVYSYKCPCKTEWTVTQDDDEKVNWMLLSLTGFIGGVGTLMISSVLGVVFQNDILTLSVGSLSAIGFIIGVVGMIKDIKQL